MRSAISTTLSAFAISVSALVGSVRAADAQCTGKITWWNSKQGDSPCKMFADLIRACEPAYELPSLGVGYQYVAPYDNGCSCTTVAASLAAACVDCQHDLETHGAPWTETYTNNTCSSSQITIAALPKSVKYGNVASLQASIPAWAFLDISSSYWIYSRAYDVAMGTPVGSSAVATATGTAPTTQSTTTNSTPTNEASTSKKFPIAPVVGGVCGGIAILLSLYWFIAGCRKKRAASNRRSAGTAPTKGWEVEAGKGPDMEQGLGGGVMAVTPYQFSQQAGRESIDQVGPLGVTAVPFNQVSRSNTYTSTSSGPGSAYPQSDYRDAGPMSPDGRQSRHSPAGYFPPTSSVAGSSSLNSSGGPGGLRPSHGAKSMRDSYDGQTVSASTPPVSFGSGGSTPNSLASPAGAYAPLISPGSIASTSSAPHHPPALHLAIPATSPTSPGMQHVQAPIVPDRMLVEGREQDSGMTFEELGAPVAVSLPPSYEQASERPAASRD